MKATDTSLVVAAFASWHEKHEAARRALDGGLRLAEHCALETYSVPTNVTLQISATHNNAAGSNNLYKTIRLQGGGLEGYQFNGDSRGTTLTISNQIEFTSDLQIGRSGIDAGRATVVSAFNGSFTEVNPGLDFIKVGGDIIQLGGGAKNYTGDTIVRSGELRNGVANAVRTTDPSTVSAEVLRLYGSLYDGAPATELERAFRDAADLYAAADRHDRGM